tara:strand:- start:65 stop:688 length:624 start_codon:yes stop_codon:yes gene_type:complete
MKERINIDERYFKEDEIRTNTKPYEAYYSCLNSTFNLSEIKSFCDAGCANGPLMYELKKNNNNIELLGIEYFQWQKDAADKSIKEDIVVHDLRDEFVSNKKYDIVNCTETGEHIDPEYADTFIENLKVVCGKYLIISWSDTGGINDIKHDEHVQHLNPLTNNQVDELLIKHGFKKNNELTTKFINSSIGNNDFNFWWRKSLGVWEIN